MRNRFLIVCTLLAAIPARATDSDTTGSSLTESDASGLEAGEFLWQPALAPSGPMRIVVSLRAQRAYVYRDDVLIGVSTISSGKPGYRTPTGTFTVLEKKRFHRSNKYDDAPMPFMERLTWSGLALHGGHARGYPTSHGCIRLPTEFAATLFEEATRGMQVVITNEVPGEEQASRDARDGAQSRKADGPG